MQDNYFGPKIVHIREVPLYPCPPAVCRLSGPCFSLSYIPLFVKVQAVLGERHLHLPAQFHHLQGIWCDYSLLPVTPLIAGRERLLGRKANLWYEYFDV